MYTQESASGLDNRCRVRDTAYVQHRFQSVKFDRYRKSITVVDVADVTIDDSIMFPHVKSLLDEIDK
jgi:hypothetical protein